MLRRMALLVMLCSACTFVAHAEELFGITTDNTLVRFDSTTPGTVTSTLAVTGLQTGESVLGLDFRPFDGKLYALGSTSRIYTINPATGAATAVSTAPFTPALSGTRFGFDFNPTSQGTGTLIRVVSNTAQNLRVNSTDGTVFDTQPTPAFVNAGLTGTPSLTGAAYTNNTFPSAGTSLFVLDSNKDALFQQEQVTTHGLTLVGYLGIDFVESLGFDISGQTGVAFAALQKASSSKPTLYALNLVTGSAIEIGDIGVSTSLVGITAAVAPLQIAYAVNGTSLRKFLLNSPATQVGSSVTITGAPGIVGIDFRPATGELYALTSNANMFGIFKIDLATGAGTQVGSNFVLPNTPAGTFYDIDFNPTVDRIRMLTSRNGDYRFHPDTGALVSTDGDLAFNAVNPADVNVGDTPRVTACAYTNSFGGATSTTLYDLDDTNDILCTQSPPNNGTLNTVGELRPNGAGSPTSVGDDAAFDIGPDGRAFCTLGNNTLYQVNLATGAIISMGSIVNSSTEFAIPTNGTASTTSPGAIAFSAASFSVVEGTMVAVTLTRTGGSSGLCSVFVTTNGNVAGNSASEADYAPLAQTVTFSDGETTRTVLFEALTDSVLEVFETVQLVIINPVGCAIGTQNTTSIVIVDVDDRDGDGFTTEEENAAGTSDNDASSTPFGGAPAGTADITDMLISKASVRLTFNKPGRDQIGLGGTLSGLGTLDLSTLNGNTVLVNFGGVIGSGTLTSKGSTDRTNKSFAFKLSKPKSGVSKFSVKFSKGDFSTALTDEGLGDDEDSPTKAIRMVNVRLLFNGVRYEQDLNLETTIKTGKGTNAKSLKVR
jgi:hypothetical protein